MRLVYLFVIVGCVIHCNGARILAMIPTPSISHQVVFRPWFQELAKRGHEVVVITPDPAFEKGKAPPNLTEVDVHDISYENFRKAFLETSRGEKDIFFGEIEKIYYLMTEVFDSQLNATAVQDVIFGQKKFDLLILEAWIRPALALSHVLKAPVILGSSLGPVAYNLDVIGAPSHPLLYSTLFKQRIYNLSMWEKIVELYHFYGISKILDKNEEFENRITRKYFGQDFPPLSELQKNVEMLFLNIHPIFEGNHPVPPGVIYMWGIHRKPEKELPQDLKYYLDNSKNGVIYMSFGSNTDPSKLPPVMINIFMKVFCQLPHDVLFKWDRDELPGRCKNVKIGKWFPQSDLLRHPKIKLFVTQGGLQSTDEAISAGVPLVGIPMLGDQWYNVEKYVHFKIGVHLEASAITEESFKNAITTILEDESYRRNTKKLDELMRDEPMPPLERVVWWTEHVLRHGGAKHLRAPAANISWAEYYEMELVVVVLSVVFVALTIFLLVVRYLYCIFLSLNCKKSKEE